LAAYRPKKAENNLTIQNDFNEVREHQHSESIHLKVDIEQSQE